jgi:uncharacterized membrane protein YhiD involved in acid resistance
MESFPAFFSGAVCALFGAALLLWASVRIGHREPVVTGPRPLTAAVFSVVFGVAFLAAGLLLLLGL